MPLLLINQSKELSGQAPVVRLYLTGEPTPELLHSDQTSSPDQAGRLIASGWPARALGAAAPYRHMMRLLWRPMARIFQPAGTRNQTVIWRFLVSCSGSSAPRTSSTFSPSDARPARRSFRCASISRALRDANRRNISSSGARARLPTLSVVCIWLLDASEPPAFYDAIFCMTVLRHGTLGAGLATRCDHLIQFETFAAAIADLHRCLNPGDLLIVRHNNFPVCDTPLSAASHCE